MATSHVDTIVVDPRSIKQTIPSDFFGMNVSAFWDDAATSRASSRALAQTPIRVVRFPGGAPSDWYDWQEPYYGNRSHTSPLQIWRYARSFGGNHLIFGTNYQGHAPPPPGHTYAVNSAQNAAAWVTYNRRNAISADMEVGNEEDMNLMHKADDPAYMAYIHAFNRQAKAMHQANSHVRVLGPVGTNEYYWWGLDGLGMFLKGTGNKTGTGQVDGVSLHFYSGRSWGDSRGAAQYWLSRNGPWSAIQRAIRANDTRKLPVFITEWNIGASSTDNSFNATFGHALVTADMMGAFALSGVKQEDYFVIHSARGWGLLYGSGESRPLDTPTPTYYALVLWKHMGTQMLSVKQNDDSSTATSTYATRTKTGSLQVLAINKQPKPRRLRIEIQGESPAGHHMRIYSLRPMSRGLPSLDATYDGKKTPSPLYRLPGPASPGRITGQSIFYTLPPYSAVVLDVDVLTNAPALRWQPPTPSTISTSQPAPDTGLRQQFHGLVSHVYHAVRRIAHKLKHLIAP